MPSIKTLFVCGISAFLPAVAANAAVIATADLGNSRYHLLGQNDSGTKTWFEFEAEAQALGGHLATVEDAFENAFIMSAFSQIAIDDSIDNGFSYYSVSLFIGLSDHALEGNFVWSSGSGSSYRQWGPGQPNSSVADEDFVGILAEGLTVGVWHDIVGDDRLFDLPYGVAEVVVPLPAAIIPMLTVIGMASAAAVRQRRSQRG